MMLEEWVNSDPEKLCGALRSHNPSTGREMTKEEILQIAAECGNDNGTTLPEDLEFLVVFARAVAAAERKACAKVCDDIDTEYRGEDVLATWCAAAIRARR